MEPERCDVLVVGGGPGGSTASALLSDLGWRVVLLEKEQHPRFHVGESLLPMNLELFRALGVLEKVAELGIPKYGVHFNSPSYSHTQTFLFAEGEGISYPPAFEVRRSKFDSLLLDNAIAKGVEVHQKTKVTAVEVRAPEGPVVTATDPSGRAREWKPSFLVDASGRDTVLANRLGMKNPNRKHASISVFAHFRGVERLPGRHEGDISIFWFPHGWFWLIPLRDGTESVGVVCWPSYWKMYGSTDLREFLWNSIRRCPPLERRMGRAAEAGPATAAGNYSYRAKRAYGERYVLIGDAFTFTDPVFSSGVFVAMHSAYMAARAVDASLRSPGQSGRHLHKYEKEFLGGVNKLSWMIYRMTSPAMQYLFMNPRNYLGMKDTIISILSGNIFNRDASSSRYFLFKVLYYICSAAMFRQCLRAYHMRKRNINFGLDQ